MNTQIKPILLSLCLPLVLISCMTAGCGQKQQSDTTTTSAGAMAGKVSATPPPGFDVGKAKAAQNAAQKGSEEFQNYLKNKKN